MSTSGPVTMPHANHPDDEQLAALAAAEPDADADGSRAAHVAGCERCAGIVADLRSLASALGELPDLRPTRPLRFLPPVDAAPSGTGQGWVELLRRVTGPAMGIAAVLILIGALGTATSSAPQAAGTFTDKEIGAAAGPLDSAGESKASAQDRDGYGLTPRAAASPTPSPAAGFGNATSSRAAASDSLRSSASSPPRPAEGVSSGRPPFEAILAIGIVLLTAMLLARAAVQRREPPGTG